MRDRVPFAHLLPLLDLTLLVIFVLIPITLTSLHLYHAAGSSATLHVHTALLDGDLPRSQIVPLAIRIVTLQRAALVRAVNLPGALIEAGLSLAVHGWPLSLWHPSALLFETWTALVYPFFALPFWWLVGRGLDTLVFRERLSALLPVVGAVLCLTAIAFALHFAAGLSSHPELLLPMRYAWAWAAGFALVPGAWLAQGLRGSQSRP